VVIRQGSKRTHRTPLSFDRAKLRRLGDLPTVSIRRTVRSGEPSVLSTERRPQP
jgi:hypothetical protein